MDRHRDVIPISNSGSPATSPTNARSTAAAQRAVSDSPSQHTQTPSYIRSRISNACDGCKARKVKCDGKQPCSYCVRRQRPHACRYTPQQRRARRSQHQSQQHPQQQQQQDREREEQHGQHESSRVEPIDDTDARREPQHILPSIRTPRLLRSPPPSAAATTATRETSRERDQPPAASSAHGTSSSTPVPSSTIHARPPPTAMEGSPEADTEVPREARLLCDPQGKLIFIGDCAPLSLFQSIRQIVTRYVGPDAFAPETSRYSVLENASGETSSSSLHVHAAPDVHTVDVARAVSNYAILTSGLIDLFDSSAKLTEDILIWANLDTQPRSHSLTANIYYLVLAIGCHRDNEAAAHIFFDYARDSAWRSLGGSLGVGTSQTFLLITMYMLCSSQINSAFLVFGMAVRAAHSIGVHRTEVNARFGPDIHQQRDRLWKSLRVVDLYLSTSMGRPPSTSDVDCTVPYRGTLGDDGEEAFDLLNASVQILLIVEGIVLEIYSRRKISLRLTEGVSHQLREWSGRWLPRLKDVLARQQTTDLGVVEVMSGACQVLSTYYYAVMLVSRPFLMYELCRRLSDAPSAPSPLPDTSSTLISGKSKLADACIDAASLMVEPILDLIERGILVGRMPVLVSWLFASSLVLGVGLLGGFGRILDRYTRTSICALDHFAKSDTHAYQYSLIAQSLLHTARETLERRELQERLRRTENSSQLFGLIPLGLGRRPETAGEASIRVDVGDDDPSRVSTPADGGTSGGRVRRESIERSYLLQQQHHQLSGSHFSQHQHHHNHQHHPQNAHHQQLHTSIPSPRFGDMDAAFVGMADSTMPAAEGNFWAPYLGAETDQASTLNLFPLLDAGGGIDLANYL